MLPAYKESYTYYSTPSGNTQLVLYRRKSTRKRKILLQVLGFKLLSLFLIAAAAVIVFISPEDGSASVACLVIGLTGLLVPYNMEITW